MFSIYESAPSRENLLSTARHPRIACPFPIHSGLSNVIEKYRDTSRRNARAKH